MNNLTYKGIRSTRFMLIMLIISLGSIFLGLSMITQDNWIDLLKWTFGTYATSEAAAKGAEAYRKPS